MDTVSLEIVRQGPPNNQLLSPLVPYVALAGNRPAETIYVPVDHGDLIARLGRLTYGVEQRDGQLVRKPIPEDALRSLGQLATNVLESIRGLGNAVAEQRGARGHSSGLLHLRLVLSAQELSLIPFELAQGPQWLGGTDTLAAFRPPPAVVTREARRIVERHYAAPDIPKILVVCANPSNDSIPLASTMLALRRALGAKIPIPIETSGRAEPDNGDRILETVRSMVDVLPNATVDGLRAKMAETQYTHVHILAHGTIGSREPGRVSSTFEDRVTSKLDDRPTIMFHDPVDARTIDFVDGDRLAAALTAPSNRSPSVRQQPLVVTLGVCHTGKGGSVVFPGGSIAHTLHATGIPVVLASQFALTFEGAVSMVESFYRKLLEEHDPREAFAVARDTLFTRLSDSTSDWAALVLYASLKNEPQDASINRQITRVKLSISGIDPNYFGDGWRGKEQIGEIDKSKLNALAAEVEVLHKNIDSEKALRFLANAHKHVAHGFARLLTQNDPQEPENQRVKLRLRASLVKSRDCYLSLFERFNRNDPWIVVQIALLSLRLEDPEMFAAHHDLARLRIEREIERRNHKLPSPYDELQLLVQQLTLLILDATKTESATQSNSLDDLVNKATRLVDLAATQELRASLFFNMREFDRIAWDESLPKQHSALAAQIRDKLLEKNVANNYRWDVKD